MSYNPLIATAAVALAAIAMPGAAQAKASETTGVFADGVAYEYASQVKDGRLILTGSWDHGEKPFYLVVANGRVRGEIGSNPVSFRLNEARADAPKVTVR